MIRIQYLEVFHREQHRRLDVGESLNISSYDLFIVQSGIECAMYPHLYPTADFTDTGIQQHYQDIAIFRFGFRFLSRGITVLSQPSWSRVVGS